jgi:hypothetical protein
MPFGIKKKEKKEKKTNSTSRPTRGPRPQTLASTAARAAFSSRRRQLCVLPISLYSSPSPTFSLLPPSLLSLTARYHAPKHRAPWPLHRAPGATTLRLHATPTEPRPCASAAFMLDARARAIPAATAPAPCVPRRAMRAPAKRHEAATVSLLRLMDFISSVSSPPLPPSISGDTDDIKPCNGVKRRRPMTSMVSFLLPSLSL